MAAKKKYVPGRAAQRAAISNQHKAVINPDHVAFIQIGLELALSALIGRTFTQADWFTLREASNVLFALDRLFHDSTDAEYIQQSQAALKRINHRYLERSHWIADAVDVEAISLMVAIYHEVIRKTTYNQLQAACAAVDKEYAQERKA
jgi:hypothetical protein